MYDGRCWHVSGIRYELRLFVPQQFEIRQSSNWCRVAGKSLVADLDLAASNRSSCETMEQHEEIDLTGTTASSNVEDSMITLNLKMCVYMYCTRGNNVLYVLTWEALLLFCVFWHPFAPHPSVELVQGCRYLPGKIVVFSCGQYS